MTTSIVRQSQPASPPSPVFGAPQFNLRGGLLAGSTAVVTFWLLANASDGDRVMVSLVLGLSAGLCGTASWSGAQVTVLWGTAAIGSAFQMRLGVPAGQCILFIVTATIGFLLAATASRFLAGRVVDPPLMARAGIASLAAALILRLLPVLNRHLSAGTLSVGGTSLQIGEFTRILVIVGFGLVAWTSFGSIGHRNLSRTERRTAVVGVALTGANVGLLAVVDTGPFVVVTASLVTVAVLAIGRLRNLLRRVRVWLGAGIVLYLGWCAISQLGVLSRLEQRWGNVSDPDQQLRTALRAAQSGGLIGRGIGSSPMAPFIPVAKSDFIPAVVAADLGFLALGLLTAALLIAFSTLLVRVLILRTSVAIIAAGLLVALGTQTLITVLGALGAIPMTGLSTPALAATGSALVSTFIALGITTAAVPAPGALHSNLTVRGPVRPPRPITALSAGIVVYMAALAVLPVDPALEGLFMKRGEIRTSDGVAIATTADNGSRRYPHGAEYSDVGYLSPGYGAYGVESLSQSELTCGGQPSLAATLLQIFQRPACVPQNISLTLRADLQDSIAAAAGNLNAQVVVSDSATGAITGMYSNDQPDPSIYEEGQFPAAPSRREASAPGSTFKLIVAAAALLKDVSPSDAPTQVLKVGGTELRNDDGFTCPDTSITTMIALSCNTTAGYLALKVGQPELERVAKEYFGATEPLGFDGGEVAPLLTGRPDVPLTPAQIARTGIGQESVQASPMAMNAVTAVIARSALHESEDSGEGIPALHVTDGTASSQRFGKLLPAAVAKTIMAGMHEAVSRGTVKALGQSALLTGHDVAAKTGTAEVPKTVSTTGVDSWVTAIVDGRWVITVRVHNADPSLPNEAVGIAADILYRIPTA